MLLSYRRFAMLGVLACALASCRSLLKIDDQPAGTVVTEDAGLDGETEERGADAGAASKDSCEGLWPPPTFCANFDGEGDIREGWDNAIADPDPGLLGNGVSEADTAFFMSPPRAAAFSTPDLLDESTKASAVLFKQFDRIAKTLIVELWIRVETEYFPDIERGGVSVASVHFGRDASVHIMRAKLGVQLVTATTKLVDAVILEQPFQVGAWKRISIIVDNTADGGAGTVQALVDRAPAAKVAALPGFATKPPSVWIGAYGALGPAGKFRAQFDDVQVSLDPR